MSSSTTTTRIWKSAVDPKSGKTYYYDAITRQTQWAKPPELATAQEKKAMLEKQRKQTDFFRAMEANILHSLQAGHLPGDSSHNHQLYSSTTSSPETSNMEERDEFGPLPQSVQITGVKTTMTKIRTERPLPVIKKPHLVRTISTMDEKVIAELTEVNVNVDVDYGDQDDAATASILRRASMDATKRAATEMMSLESIDFDSMDVEGDDDDDEANIVVPNMVHLSRRNTCGTMYVGTTMSEPDTDATIKCVCGVFRAHMLQSAQDAAAGIEPIPFEEYDVFLDVRTHQIKQQQKNISGGRYRRAEYMKQVEGNRTQLQGLSLLPATMDVPSLEEITQFYRDIFRKSQMEADTVIMSLIYVERIIKETNGGVRPKVENWKSVLFSSMIMASKVWDDLSMWNSDFSQVCKSFTLQRVNELELAMLSALKYSVKVTASEYAKYYFLLRSMLIRSGLGSADQFKNLNPLDIEGAKKLEYYSGNYERTLLSSEVMLRPSPNDKHRSKSMTAVDEAAGPSFQRSTSDTISPPAKTKGAVTLEQVVRM